MVYPKNLKVENKTDFDLFKEYWKEIGYQIKHKIKYFIHDRNNFIKRILIKLHM